MADRVNSILEYADAGWLPIVVLLTAVNGVAEELFFRGAAYAAITRHPVAWTTLAHGVATLATGNVMLSFAALILGPGRRTPASCLRRDPGADPDSRHLVDVDAADPAAGHQLTGPSR